MHNILNDLSVATQVTAIKTNLFDWYRYLGRSPNVDLHDDLRLSWLLTGLPLAFLNAVFHTQLLPGGECEIIATALANFKSKQVTRLFWYPEPEIQATDLGKHLVAHGLTYGDGLHGMAADLLVLQTEMPRVPDLTIVPVADKETLKKWAHAAWLGYELPQSGENIFFDLFTNLGFELPLRSYIAFLKEEPVATSQLFLSAGVAGIYWVATVPEARGQGLGTAITLAPLLDAQQMGYRIGILHATQMGYPVYSRLGFQEYCKMSRYLWKNETEAR